MTSEQPIPENRPEESPTAESCAVEDQVAPPAGPVSPYRNLLVPLVVVPALIVVVIVLVYVLFSSIAGSEAGLHENLRRLREGGVNERQQAAFALVQQVSENRLAELEGRQPPWEVDQTLLPELEQALAEVDPEDRWEQYVLASLLADLDPERGIPRLAKLLDLGEAEDPGGETRFRVLLSLGAIGDASAFDAIARFVTDDDPGLRLVAAAAMQRMPAAKASPAVRDLLEDPVLEVRVTAAITLASLGDPAGAPVLRDATQPDPYRAERARDASRFPRDADVSRSRVTALRALATLRLAADRERFERLASEQESDLAVRDAAKRVLVDWEEGI